MPVLCLITHGEMFGGVKRTESSEQQQKTILTCITGQLSRSCQYSHIIGQVTFVYVGHVPLVKVRGISSMVTVISPGGSVGIPLVEFVIKSEGVGLSTGNGNLLGNSHS